MVIPPEQSVGDFGKRSKGKESSKRKMVNGKR
jgi:hypothetical protein